MRLLPLPALWAAACAAAGSLSPTAPNVPGTSEAYELAPLAPRDLNDFQLARFVLIATLDGALEARDRSTGLLLWRTESDPLLQVEQIAGDEDDVDAVWITEFTDSGRLMYFNPVTGLEQIPASIKDLVDRTPFAVPGNIVYTGRKSTVMYAFDASTGEVINAYGSMSPLVPPSKPLAEAEGLVHLGRTDFTLEIHERTSARAWRLRFSKWELNLRDTDLEQQYLSPLDNMYIFPISNNTVMAAVEGDVRPSRWIRDIDHTIKVFDVLWDGKTYVVLPQPPLQLPETGKEGALYVDTTKDGGFYALGQDYQAVVVSTKNAPWCTGARTFRSRHELANLLTGVHPPWCRGQSAAPHQIGPSPERPQLPPAPQPPPSWYVRLFEEVFRFTVLTIFLLIAARQDWFPELFAAFAEFARNSRKTASEPSTTEPETPSTPGGGATPATPGGATPQKRKRGKRGGRKVRDAKRKAQDEEGEILGPLMVSNEILGYGSHGTTVLRGRFQNREVAIKRMLLSFFETANREIRILQESDDHQNVVRYYCKHETDQFLYIALELCPGTIEDLLNPEKHDKRTDLLALKKLLEPLNALQQIVDGVDYLHSLKIVHRDIKPQNILVANPKTIYKRDENNNKVVTAGPVRLLISDFGLCKKLDSDQSSFHNTATTGAGTSGWTAPEISMGSRYVAQSGGSEKQPSGSDSVDGQESSEVVDGQGRRLTRAVDIFSLGCVFYYVLSPGLHPFGEGYMRQPNIENHKFNLNGLAHLKYAQEATDLIESMIAFSPHDRPDTREIMRHPLFWSDRQKLDLLCKVSDRLEHDTREEYSEVLQKLEKHAALVVGADWHQQFPPWFVENLGRYRKYHGDRIIDLLRAMRNKLNHFNDFDDDLKEKLGPIPSGYLEFFTKKFPNLFMVVYHYAKENFRHEDVFIHYFQS